jgi:bifunctional non-homologous end joining protein LigD
MLATLGSLPAAAVDGQWGYEMKWDGVRALVRIESGQVSLISRNGIDMRVAYPELVGLGERVGSTPMLLDGEIVAFDAAGRPSFARLQKRMHVTDRTDAQRLAGSDPAVLLLFDILHLDSRSLLAQPYTQRRQVLTDLQLPVLADPSGVRRQRRRGGPGQPGTRPGRGDGQTA